MSEIVKASVVVSCMLGIVAVVLTGCAAHHSELSASPAAKELNGTEHSASAALAGNESKAIEAEKIVSTESMFGPRNATLSNTNTLTPAPGSGSAPQGAEAAIPPLDVPYRIGPGDVLVFRSFDDEKLSGQVVVRYDGIISLPLIPDLKVEGFTREEALKAIQAAYTTVYYEPQIALTIAETQSKFYAVMGDVEFPSQFPYQRPITLLDAIISAGSIRQNQASGGGSYPGSEAQLVKAFVIRHTNGHRDVIECDLRHMKIPGDHASDTPILPNDVVYVPTSVALVYVLGEVGRPTVYQLQEDMTLIQLLTFAGGPKEPTSWMKHIVLIRAINTEHTKVMLVNVKEILKTGKGDIPLAAGDVIYVPQRRLVQLDAFVAQVMGVVQPPITLASSVLSLYTQAYTAYYTKAEFDLLFRNGGGTGYTNTLAALQDVAGLNTLLRTSSGLTLAK